MPTSVKSGAAVGHGPGFCTRPDSMNSPARRVALIIRPPADEDRLEALRTAVTALRQQGHHVRGFLTFEAGDAARFARLAARRGYDVVMAAGGDGTVNEVVNGLVRLARPPQFGVVPLGTANDFAGGLNLPSDATAALQVAVTGWPLCIDVPRLNNRYFINVSTGGFGAEATKAAPRSVKRWLGPLAYYLAGARRLMSMEPSHARFTADGSVIHDGPFVFFAVGNARRTGGGTRVTPEADVDDGQLDVMIMGNVSRLRLVSTLPSLRAGTHLRNPRVSYTRAREIVVESATPLAVNADGEAIRSTTLRYTVGQKRLELMLPE
jgi:diacylglycerol kinase (ATP)